MSQSISPLKGVKIIDFTMYVAAPAATAIFGYLGADVIKVETPKGDPYRGMGASFGMPVTDDENPLYDTVNGYKKGLSLDMRTEGGKAVMRRLIEQADIFVTNFRDKALQGMGLTYEEVKAINPRIVYGMGYGYGPKGPDADRPGYDSTTFFGRSGFAQEAAYVGAAPAVTPSGAGDTVTSSSLAIGVLAAYLQARETGVGCMVHTSLFTSALWALNSPIARRHYKPRGTNPTFYDKPDGMAIFCDFVLKDESWVRFCAPTAERYWGDFCRALGLEEYIEDPRFCTTVAQAQNGRECYALMAEQLKQKTYDEWYPIFIENDLPFEKIHGVAEAIVHPQAIANNYSCSITYKSGKTINLPTPPVQLSTLTDPPVRTAAPKIGEHSREVLSDYGFSADEIESLIAEGSVKAI